MPICKRCRNPTENDCYKTRYCNECKKIVHAEDCRRYYRKHHMKEIQRKKQRKENYWIKKKEIICLGCGKKTKDYVVNLNKCKTCYIRNLRLNKKLKPMSETEKREYLINHGLLDEKKKLTIEDLKKDLGVL